MATISISPCEDYELQSLTTALEAALAPLGGMAAFVSPGQTVLLKVNLLSRALPERAVTTHPEFVRAVIRDVKAAGGRVSVGDSPGGPNTPGTVRRIWEDSGIGAVCAEEDVDLVLFDDDCVRAAAPGGTLYQSFTIGRAVAEADVLITLPKFKTHGFMMFTGAVKNLFGCIPGLEKAQYHLKVPDRDDFGGMLVDLMLACKPKLAIMDAVVGMEGDGPAGGTPRQIGAVLASADSVALDVVASSIAGLDPLEVYSNRAASRRGLGPSSAAEVDVVGTDWRELAPSSFKLPPRDPSAKLPPWVAKRVRSWVTARPVLVRTKDCTRCKKCEENCPVGAIVVGERGPAFDNSICIRCYCCQELCPPQAIGLTEPPLARWATRGRGF
jgi:uncharacterized protein (DUF362 family)/Pyruvate/2-oxoacid:ferredoxin oxidoreductase delta subunit